MIIALMLFTGIAGAYAQVTVGSDSSPKATLDVVASNTDGTTPEGIIAPRLTLAQLNAKQSQYTAAQAGAFVYITDISGATVADYSDDITCIGYAYFDGTKWMMDCETPLSIFIQPQEHTFYKGRSPEIAALNCVAMGNGTLTYQWYKIVGGNVTQACTDADGTGFNTTYFTPNAVKGPNRYYCVVTDGTGKKVTSEIAEVVVGCGAWTTSGTWLSFMCHNLGADESLDPFFFDGEHLGNHSGGDIKGDLYQWGRSRDGHQRRNSWTTTTLATDNTATAPAGVSGKFIAPTDASSDWLSGGNETSRWGDGTTNANMIKGANDPCPDGWKVPSIAQWQSIFSTNTTNQPSSAATANTWSWTGYGYKIGQYLYLPAVGYRNGNGLLQDNSTNGDYWSSTVINNTSSYYFKFINNSLFGQDWVYPLSTAQRIIGQSVRCIAEQK